MFVFRPDRQRTFKSAFQWGRRGKRERGCDNNFFKKDAGCRTRHNRKIRVLGEAVREEGESGPGLRVGIEKVSYCNVSRIKLGKVVQRKKRRKRARTSLLLAPIIKPS